MILQNEVCKLAYVDKTTHLGKSREAVCADFSWIKPSHIDTLNVVKVSKVGFGNNGSVRGQSLPFPLLYIYIYIYIYIIYIYIYTS